METQERNKGFSLIELLVSIGIIGTLIGISLPMLNRTRESSRATRCQYNLRSWGQGMELARGDVLNGRWKQDWNRTTWDFLGQYVDNKMPIRENGNWQLGEGIMKCPNDKEENQQIINLYKGSSYFSWYLEHLNWYGQQFQNQVENYEYTDDNSLLNTGERTRHLGKRNILHYDGKVKLE